MTAAEWLAAHRAEQSAEDPYRVVRDEAELVDSTPRRQLTLRPAGPGGRGRMRKEVAAQCA
ncbi:MAG: hypothetical protein GEU83_01720 [Pseudonocardiaceae bacterium]|nr:hypothetical protein [Pseudonocardiaceae bacterium]